MPTAPNIPYRRRIWRDVLSYSALGILCFFVGRFSISPVTPPLANSQSSNIRSTKTEPKPAFSNDPGPAADNSNLRWDNASWRQLKNEPASPANTAALSALLKKLAITDSQQALAMAQAEPNLMLRDTFLQAVLRGWAQSSPTDAAHYALKLPTPAACEAGLNSVFSGAVAANPKEAVRTGQLLIQENPGEAVGIGGHLIDALCQTGNFRTATEFASVGEDNTRPFWMGAAYSKWAAFQPESAAQAAASLADPTLRSQALHGVVGGWSMADPASLVKYVTQLPPDADKSSMVSQALQRWVRISPAAAADWINNNEGGPEMDHGIASVATMEALKPDVAVSWAESISNSKLRSETLVSVLRNWATVDLAATKNYFEKSKDLLPEDRSEIIGVITTLSGQSTQP